jgi:L-lactate dehydrogenase complex protein LldG
MDDALAVICRANKLARSKHSPAGVDLRCRTCRIYSLANFLVDSKTDILSKLRRQIVGQVALPEVLDGPWIEYPDPLQQFTTMIEFVGGSCKCLSGLAELPDRLAQWDEWQQAQRVFSGVPEISGNVDLDAVANPHDLENLDFVVYPAEFAVAENGAVWLTDRDLRHRVVFFITQFLVLVVKRTDIVHTMHQAYARAVVPQPGFGLFLSGPSKTADIEQSLVIGAHGCKELQVFLV